MVNDESIYAVTVSNGPSCTGAATLAASLPDLPTVSIMGSTTICEGNETTWTVLGDFTAVNWSTPTGLAGSGSSIMASQPGVYSVTATDANGCTVTASQSLATSTPPAPAIVSSPENCQGTASLSAGIGFASYAWSNGASGESISASQNGNYAVTVTDANGCTGEADFQLTLPSPPQVSILGDATLCEGYQTVLVGTATAANYLWSTGETSTSISIAAGGNYSLTITDADGCTAEAAWAVTSLPTLYTSTVLQSCSPQDTGTVVQTLTSFTGCDSVVTTSTLLVPVITTSVALSACEGSTAVFDGVDIPAGGTQIFNYTTALGCDSVVTVSVAAWPAVVFAPQTTISCWNVGTGALAVEVSAGTPPFSYSLDGGNGQSAPDFEGLAAGNYELLVQDGNGCSASQTVEVPATEPMEIKAQDRLLRCEDATLVLAPAVLSGDADQLEWRWSDGSTGPSISVTTTGVYSVSVSDGCEEQSFDIQVRPQAPDEEPTYFYVPNAFSPNADQTNDLFRAYVGLDVEVRSFELQVFDRWGNQLFVTTDPNGGWDGAHRDKGMDNAAFVWYLKATIADCKGNDLEVFRKGDVVRMR
jgi:gliding motility-associated-like protein